MFELPPGLAGMAPGPGLAAVLAGIDRSRVASVDMVTVLRAQARQAAHEQARLLADIVEVARCLPDVDDASVRRASVPVEFGADEVGLALTWTRRAAESQLGLAWDVVHRLPALWAALDTGEVDIPKVRCISQGVVGLADESAERVVDQILPVAATLTTGQLRERLRRMVLQADPEAVATQRERAVKQRRFVCEGDPDGTATLAGYGLEPQDAVAAAERIQAIASAVKNAGDPRTMDQLRADAFVGLLLGTQVGAQPGPRKGVVDLRVPLETLIGLADEPGDLDGYGPVAADIARQIARDNPGGVWRWSVFDSNGDLLYRGVTRRRPSTGDAEFVRARDRTCRAPGCRVPAWQCDLDHLVAWADGGLTTVDNLASVCRHHHRMKHGGGWRIRQVQPGVFQWISPLGSRATVSPASSTVRRRC